MNASDENSEAKTTNAADGGDVIISHVRPIEEDISILTPKTCSSFLLNSSATSSLLNSSATSNNGDVSDCDSGAGTSDGR